MLGTLRFVLGTAIVGGGVNIICEAFLSVANKSGNVLMAQHITLFRLIFNAADTTLFILALILFILNRSSPKE